MVNLVVIRVVLRGSLATIGRLLYLGTSGVIMKCV